MESGLDGVGRVETIKKQYSEKLHGLNASQLRCGIQTLFHPLKVHRDERKTTQREQKHNREKNEKSELRDELRGEFDLSRLKEGVRGKYKSSYRAGTNVVLLSPDVAGYFPGEQAVNSAWRTFIRGEAACAASRADSA